MILLHLPILLVCDEMITAILIISRYTCFKIFAISGIKSFMYINHTIT